VGAVDTHSTIPPVQSRQCPVLTVRVPASMIEEKTLVTSSRAALDSDLYSMMPSRASQTNRIGGLASW
jgi:hypothetical protein